MCRKIRKRRRCTETRQLFLSWRGHLQAAGSRPAGAPAQPVTCCLLSPSNTGLDCSSWLLTAFTSLALPETAATYCMMSLEASVLPEPLSPDITTHWSRLCSRTARYASSATAYLQRSNAAQAGETQTLCGTTFTLFCSVNYFLRAEYFI